MAKPRGTARKGANDTGGRGSSHQGGSYGPVHGDRDRPTTKTGKPTTPALSRVSGGERGRHHPHDRATS